MAPPVWILLIHQRKLMTFVGLMDTAWSFEYLHDVIFIFWTYSWFHSVSEQMKSFGWKPLDELYVCKRFIVQHHITTTERWQMQLMCGNTSTCHLDLWPLTHCSADPCSLCVLASWLPGVSPFSFTHTLTHNCPCEDILWQCIPRLPTWLNPFLNRVLALS